MDTNINDLRNNIDQLDDQLLSLFLKRMELSEQVGQYKKENNLPIADRAREREILAKVKQKAGDNEEYAYLLYSKLLDLSKARQMELTGGDTAVAAIVKNALLPADCLPPKTGLVACQGVEGANSQQACDKLLPRGDIMYVKTFEAVFDAVDSGFCQYGVVPIENNSSGSVRQVYELLQRRGFYIVNSLSLHIRHELMGKKGAKLSDITEIYSHEQAIAQCGTFLTGLGSSVKIIPCANTAVAAQSVAQCPDNHMASISNHSCAELYGLEVIKNDIQNTENNYTKFILIAKKPAIYPGANRISIVLSCANRPGALGDILSMFSSRGVNMIKLESCPVEGQSFEFLFYIELDASVREPGVMAILEELERTCESFAFLGNYQAL